MNWEQRFCVNQACATEAWMVKPDPTMCDMWWVAVDVDDHRFMIAATVPVCPHCGTTLLTLVERERECDRLVGAQVGAVFDFVRSLP